MKFRLLYGFLYPLNDETGHDSLSVFDYQQIVICDIEMSEE